MIQQSVHMNLQGAWMIALSLAAVVRANESTEAARLPEELRATSPTITAGKLVYASSLASPEDIEGWRMEGPGEMTFTDGWMHLRARGHGTRTVAGAAAGDGNHVFWCPQEIPSDFIAQWRMKNQNLEAGLCIVFFCATGLEGQSPFDESLPERDGDAFGPYRRGALRGYHCSFYAHHPKNKNREHSHLRKNPGNHMLQQGLRGILVDSEDEHVITLIKVGARIALWVDDRKCIDQLDDGKTAGNPLGAGHLFFRQMTWTHFAYRDFKVWEVADGKEWASKGKPMRKRKGP
jgi:hypothetical protein